MFYINNYRRIREEGRVSWEMFEMSALVKSL